MPVPETQQTQTLKQIQAAWDEAQDQLAELRNQVGYLTLLAQAKASKNVLDRDMDKAFKDLGEAIWAEVSKGRLQLPTNLSLVRKSLERVTEQIQHQNASINDLLSQGAEFAAKLSKPAGAAKTAGQTKMPVASGTKKR